MSKRYQTKGKPKSHEQPVFISTLLPTLKNRRSVFIFEIDHTTKESWLSRIKIKNISVSSLRSQMLQVMILCKKDGPIWVKTLPDMCIIFNFFHIRMTEKDQFLITLHKIEKTLTSEQNQSRLNQNKIKNSLKKHCVNFCKKVSQNVVWLKTRIINLLQSLKGQGKQVRLTFVQKQLLNELQSALNLLKNDVDWLLNEAILNAYIQLLHLRQKTARKQINHLIHNLIRDIIQAMSKLLLLYFTYQEYQTRATKQHRNRRISMFSHKSLQTEPSLSQNYNDAQILREIEESMQSKSIHEIINQNLNKQIASMTEQESICRICSEKTKLRNTEKHVKICQKRSDFKQELNTKRRRLNKLVNQMRQNLESIKRKSLKSKEDESLKGLITLLLCRENPRKEKGVTGRSQTFITSNGSDHQTFFTLAQEHLQAYGQHQTLQEVCRVQNEIITIEKNINSLQNAIRKLDTNTKIQDVGKKPLRRISKGSRASSRTRSSKSSEQLFSTLNSFSFEDETNQADRTVQFDQSDYSSEEDEKQSKVAKGLKREQSFLEENEVFRRFQSKTSFKEKESQPLCTIRSKNYVSLQQIPSGQQSSDKKISFLDFEVLKWIGKGAYGKVYMVRRKQTEDIYALKVLTLSDMVTEKELQLIGKEHEVYKTISGEYLTKAHFSFNEKSSHMFVLEYMPGGDLRKLLEEEVYLEQNVARFCLAEVVLGIEHLHKFGIIHRDLKPENLLLDEKGHIKLTDFGLSELKFENMLKQTKKLNEQACNIQRSVKRKTGFRFGLNRPQLIGTPDYIAPQIINYVSINNLTIDWWSLGIIAYELLIGTRPFCGQSIDEVIQNIKQFNIEWPQVGEQQGMISQSAKDLITKLLDQDFVHRLGANGASEVKDHPFFASVDWESIRQSNSPLQSMVEATKQVFPQWEDKGLRESIEQMISQGEKTCSKLKLEKFVRFDLLGSETIEIFEKIVSEKTSHLSKLKTLQKLEMLNSFEKEHYHK